MSSIMGFHNEYLEESSFIMPLVVAPSSKAIANNRQPLSNF
jgi:hypothetical protein